MLIGSYSRACREPGDRRSVRELYNDAIEAAVKAEADGFDFCFTSEHHFEADQWNPSPLTLQTAIAMKTSTLRLGTNIIQTPYYHPIRLAEDVATIDILSNGRMSVAGGTGSSVQEFETFNIPIKERHGRTVETLRIVKRMYSQDVYDHEGRYFKFPNIRLTTRPLQKRLPIFMAAMGPKNMRRAGKEGFGLTFAPVADWHVNEYLEGLAEGGHKLSDVNVCAYDGLGVVVATEREAEEIRNDLYDLAAKTMLGYQERRAGVVQSDGVSVGAKFEESDEHPGARIVGPVGTPEQVLRALEPKYKSGIVTHAIATGIYGPYGSRDLWLKEVAPVLRTWGRDPVGTEIGPEFIPENTEQHESGIPT